MKVPLSWLREYVEPPTENVGELRDILAMLGHEVEGVETVTAGWSGVRIARVSQIRPHPDADRIRVCEVESIGAPVQVVCGAWNFAPGDIVAYAEPGAVLPGDLRIGVRTIRGVESHGMICSERELELGDDHEGIMVLGPGAPIGEPLETLLALPDVVFDISVTPNRPDAMSMLGIARDVAAWYDIGIRVPEADPDTQESPAGIDVTIEDAEGNPRFVARRVDQIKVAPSPAWMRHRLRLSGVRPISNIVDVTNYVMLEMGQPLHAFDADLIADSKLVVRRGREGETLTTLDGVDRTLTEEDLVIADTSGVTSLAGTMGGKRSEVNEATKAVIIEAATWDPPTIMYMSRRHGLRSEASARFERGVDPELPPAAATRAADLIARIAGGAVRRQWVDVQARPHTPTEVTLTVAEVSRLLGEGHDESRVISLLGRLGFTVSGSGILHVLVPSYRPDVTRPVDLVEEVARLSGYDTFGERVRWGTSGRLTAEQALGRRLREYLAAIGLSQAVTLSFVMPAEVAAMEAPPDHPLRRLVTVKNPLSEEEAVLRPSLIPGLLRVIRHNRNRGRSGVAVFEQGRVFGAFPWIEDRRVPHQPEMLTMVAAGPLGPGRLDAGEAPEADVGTITALVHALSERFGLALSLRAGQAPGFHPGRTAELLGRNGPVGHVGELHPRLVKWFDLTGRVAAAELALGGVMASATEPQYRPPSPYPPADFDLSFEVPADLPAGELAAALGEAGGELTERVNAFDRFVGPGLGEDRVALAFHVRLRAGDRTLSPEEMAEVRQGMVEAAAGLGATLRGAS